MNEFVNAASEAFRNKDYQRALDLYRKASHLFGSDIFEYNIDYCKRVLEIENDNVVSQLQININEYFDEIYLVNLKSNIKDRLKASKHLRELGINAKLFEATNGYIGEPAKIFQKVQERGVGNLTRYADWNWREVKRQSSFLESEGAVGYIFTYIAIMEDAKKNNHSRILILEDDVLLARDFHDKFSRFINCVDDDWKVLLLGASQYGWQSVDTTKALNDGFYRPRRFDTCGSYALALDVSIFDQLIEAASSFESPFDLLPLGEIYEDNVGKCFVSYPYIAMADVGESTIRRNRDQYTHAQLVKWNVKDFNYPLALPSIAVIVESMESLRYINCFPESECLPFNLRLYYPSDDGLRPLHLNRNFDIDRYPRELPRLNGEIPTLPEVDYVVVVDQDDELTVKNIVRYLEYKLELARTNLSGLREIDAFETRQLKGRASVICPTYKRPENLATAARSVLEQDYSDVELIIVNDSGLDSPFIDETRSIVDALRSEFPHRIIELIEHKINRNGAAARNTGIHHSTGEFIMFLDDDDMYLPGRISKSVEGVRKSRGIDGAVYCGFLGWNSPVNDLERYAEGDLTAEILTLDYKKHYLHTNTATYKRHAVLDINGFDESYRRHQDLEFNLRFFRKFKVGTVKEALVRLNPAPSDVSNKVYDLDMLSLKEKFLTQFAYVISEYPELERDIYLKHWSEARRYLSDLTEFYNAAAEQFKNAWLQLYIKSQ